MNADIEGTLRATRAALEASQHPGDLIPEQYLLRCEKDYHDVRNRIVADARTEGVQHADRKRLAAVQERLVSAGARMVFLAGQQHEGARDLLGRALAGFLADALQGKPLDTRPLYQAVWMAAYVDELSGGNTGSAL